MRSVVGMFDTMSEAESAIERLQDMGINVNCLGIAYKATSTTDATRAEDVSRLWGGAGNSAQNSKVGSSVTASLQIPTRTVNVSGFGAFVVGGLIFDPHMGTGLDGLIDSVVPRVEAEHFATALERGQIIVAAHVDSGDVSELRAILEEEGSLRTFNS